ncbi:MAG: EpsI family protein [Betaproteobacteria bacterium]|nr:EpsI family protein [Betaproteobacteria bacterium]
MKSINWRLLIAALLMVVGAGLALAMKPTQKIADTREKPVLDTMIPRQIGEWKVDPTIIPITPSPDVQALLDKLYNQVLARTYVNPAGRRIMLSIAYGGDQSDSMRVHEPEVCYGAQGFDVSGSVAGTLLTEYGELPVKRLIAVQGNRNEPITYWVVVGDKATLPGLTQKFAQLSYGLTGKVPDGFLVRISSIDPDRQTAYQLEEEFIKSMLDAMSEKDRARISSRFGA